MAGAETHRSRRRPALPPALAGILAVLRLLPTVRRGGAGLFALAVLVSAVLPIAIAVLTGLLVGSIPAAVAGDPAGDGTPDPRAVTYGLLAGVAALVVAQRVLTPVRDALATTLGREVERYLRERVMAAVGRPTGIAHLEHPQILDELRVVRGLGMDTNRPDLAVQGLARVLPAWVQALGSAAILLWFHWWLGLAWLVVWPVVVFVMQREYVRVGQVGYGLSGALRRAEYLRDLAITAPAAKELRVWGMLDWLVSRFHAAWRAAIEPVWKVRRPRTRVVFGSSGTGAGDQPGLVRVAGVRGRPRRPRPGGARGFHPGAGRGEPVHGLRRPQRLPVLRRGGRAQDPGPGPAARRRPAHRG
jgi:hypothetical protein